MWTFFSGEENQSFHHILQWVCDSPKLEAASVKVPESVVLPPSSPVPAHHAFQLFKSAPSPLDIPKTQCAEVGSCESHRTPFGFSANLSRNRGKPAQVPQLPGLSPWSLFPLVLNPVLWVPPFPFPSPVGTCLCFWGWCDLHSFPLGPRVLAQSQLSHRVACN